MIASRMFTVQAGIRQRSLRRHCRLGRATELVFVLATGATLVVAAGAAQAQDKTWTGTTDGLWDLTTDNWDPTTWANGNTANFAGAAPGTITLAEPIVANGINISADGYSFTASDAADTLTLTNSINVTTSGITATFSNLTVASSLQYIGDGNLTLTGVSGAGVTLSGFGTVTVDGGNYTGSLTQENSAGVTIGATGTTFAALDGTATNTVTLNGTLTLNGSTDGSYAGIISGTGGLTYSGSGTQTLSGANTFTGGTIVSGGTVSLTGGSLGDVDAQTGGTFTQTAGTSGGVQNSGGTVNLNGGTATSLTNASGAGTSTVTDGQVTGTTTISAGSVVVDETTDDAALELSGAIGVSGSGTLTVTDGQVGAVTNNGGTVGMSAGAGTETSSMASLTNQTGTSTLSGGAVTGQTSVSGGEVANTGATLGAVAVTGGTYDQDGGSAGAVTNTVGTVELSAGTVASVTQTGTGTTTLTGTVAATNGIDIQDGNLSFASGTLTGNLTIGSAADTVTLDGTVDGNLTTAKSLAISNEVTGNFSNSAAGTTLSSTVGSLTNTGGTLVSTGTVTGTAQISGGTFTNDANGSVGGLTSVGSGATVIASGGTFGAVTVESGGTFSLDTSNDTTPTNTTIVQGDFINNGTIDTTDGGPTARTIDATGYTFTNNGSIIGRDGNSGRPIVIIADTIVIQANASITGDVTYQGSVQTGGDIDISNDLQSDVTVLAGGSGTFTDNVDANGNDITNGGRMVVLEGFDVTAVGSLTNTGGTPYDPNTPKDPLTDDGFYLQAGATMAVPGPTDETDREDGQILNDGGYIQVGGGGAELSGLSLVNQNSGSIFIAAGGTLSAGSIDNEDGSEIIVAGTLEGTGNTINNNGTTTVLAGGAVTDNGAINNTSTGSYIFEGGGSINADANNDDPGDTHVLTNEGLFQTNTSGTVLVGNTGDEDFYNTGSGRIDVNTGSTLDVEGTIFNDSDSAEAIDVATGATLTFTLLDSSDGTVTNAGDMNGAIDISGGTFTNTGTADGVTNSGGTVNLNDGTFATLTTSGGTTTVTDGQVTGATNINGGSVEVDEGVDGGDVELVGTTTITAGGQLTITDGQVGAVTNNSTNGGSVNLTMEAAGTIASLQNTQGEAQLNGGVVTGATGVSGGEVTNDNATLNAVNLSGTGTYDQNGGSAGVVTNSGGAFQLGGGTITSMSQSSGSTTVDGTTGAIAGLIDINGGSFSVTSAGVLDANGGVDINGSASSVQIDGTVDGNLSTASAATVSGTGDITGTFTNSGSGSSLAGSAGSVSNTGGSLEISGTVDGAVTVTGGDVDLAGGSAASLSQTGGSSSTTVSASSTVTGLVDINDGDFTIDDEATLTTTAVDIASAADTVTINGTLGGALIASGDVAVGATGSVTGTTIVNSGATVTATGTADFAAVNVVAGGEFDSDADTTFASVTSSGTLSGVQNAGSGSSVTVNAGTAAEIQNSGGTVNLDGGTTAQLTTSGGTSTITEGVVTTANINGGEVVVNESDDAVSDDTAREITGTTTITGTGLLTITDGQVGAVVNNGDAGTRLTMGSGTGANYIADVSVPNTYENTIASLDNQGGDASLTGGRVVGSTTISGGTVTNDGALMSGFVNVTAAGGTYDQDSGTAAAGVQNDGGSVELSGGTVSGLANNSGTSTITGGTVTGATTIDAGTVELSIGAQDGIADLASVTVDGGLFDFNSGDVNQLTNNAGGEVQMSGGRLLTASSSEGTMSIDGAVQFGGVFSNTGDLTLLGTAGITGAGLSNSGTIFVSGSGASVASLNSTGTIDMRDDIANPDNGQADDALTVTGNATLGDFIYLDIDLGTGLSDRLNVNGQMSLSGNLTLAFNDLTDSNAAFATGFIPVIDYGTQDFSLGSISTTGLPSGSINYVLINDTTSGVLGVQGASAAGVLASGVVLTQSLLNSVVNRPSSPFVAGLAAAEDDPCGPGVWARTTFGQADADGTIAPDNFNGAEIPGSISADYYGVQIGSDFSCFGGYYNGWDLSFGGIVGVNQGMTSQPVRNFVISDDNVAVSAATSFNDTEFTQAYAGLYLGASRDRLFADLQYRYEMTDFQVENVDNGSVLGDGTIGLDTSFSTTANTLSGSVGYVFPISEEQGINFVPSAGFAYTQTEGSEIEFEDGSILIVEDSSSQIAFLAGTISRTQIRPDGISALNYFGTATVYSDFAAPTESEYFQAVGGVVDIDAGGDRSESSNLGTYGELSVGVNYTRLLEPGDIGASRQFNASVRVDGRFSDDIESVGLTAQARLQF